MVQPGLPGNLNQNNKPEKDKEDTKFPSYAPVTVKQSFGRQSIESQQQAEALRLEAEREQIDMDRQRIQNEIVC